MGIFDWIFGGKPKATTPQFEEQTTLEHEPVDSPEITPQEVQQKMDAGENLILLDVREPQEVEICCLEGAKHIPMGDIHERYKEVSDDPNAEIIVYCHHGSRSMQVMHQLWGLGFQNAKNLSGGIHAWSLDVDPSVPRY